MSVSSIKYDPRYGSPSEEILRKLELSRREAEALPKKVLNCPICGFRIMGTYEDRRGHVEIKCRKCKFEGPVNLAYFRRQRRSYRHIRWSRRRNLRAR